MQKKTFLFGSLLIIAGLICLSIPLFHEIQQLVKVNQLEAAMSQISYENHEEANDEEIDFEGSPLSEIYTVEVPSVRVKEYVKAETTEENLKIAATQIKPNQKPGEGNFAIAGHRGYRGDRLFGSLPDVEVGESIYLHDESKTYVYEVSQVKKVSPESIEVVEDISDHKIITLVTCTRDGKNRIVVQGHLKS
ncbi:class D sortase [Geomicrobium sp. JCM 19039]|uniref:class D sortase n=1 Tax=Geomicrobium sp. JCM 19039 TaxID=1460636 RepID=UPI00045F3B49|nr:class D sortase [Geomicrobium sp. JCM 19039]GAK13142.1 sortase A [Geomicrobium sp. JCM 19039]